MHQGLECQQVRCQILAFLCLCDTWVRKGNRQYFGDQSANVNLEFGDFLSDFLVDEQAVDELVEHALAVDKFSEQVVVVDLVLGLVLEGLHDAHPLKQTPQEPLPDLLDRHRQVSNKQLLDLLDILSLLLILEQLGIHDAIKHQVFKGECDFHLDATRERLQNLNCGVQLRNIVNEAQVFKILAFLAESVVMHPDEFIVRVEGTLVLRSHLFLEQVYLKQVWFQPLKELEDCFAFRRA